MKKIFFLVALAISMNVLAQKESHQFIGKHLVRADASIVQGNMLNNAIKNVHLNGNLEYYLDNFISIRGDANWMAGSKGVSGTSIGLKENYSVLLGSVFHIQTNSSFDPYFIFQPGVAYVSTYYSNNNELLLQIAPQRTYYNAALCPLGTAGLGFNYYFQRFAHLFAEGRYVYGNSLSQAPQPISLQEIRITFGLGFNLFIIKDKGNKS